MRHVIAIILMGIFLVTFTVKSEAAPPPTNPASVPAPPTKPVPVGTNSPYGKYGYPNDSCGGCTSGYTCCSGYCYDLETDENNCSACGSACNPGETCIAHRCT